MPDPTPADTTGRLDAEGVPEGDQPPGYAGTGGDYEDIPAPGDAPAATVDWGVTAAEERIDEPLAQRVAREEPDVMPTSDPEPVADLEGDPSLGRPAEEEAVHVSEEG